MTVAEIQSVVAMYLQRSVAKFDVTGTSANLILVAMNNARKYAERRHNWSVCRKKGYLSVTTANEVAWDSPTWFGGGTEKMKEGKHWWLRGDATDVTNKVSTTDCPIKILGHGVKHVVETKQNYEAWGEDYAELRQVRESSSWHPMLNQPHGVVRGKWLELYPKPTATQVLVVDGYHWWADWTVTNTTSASNTSSASATPPTLAVVTIPNADLIITGRRRLEITAIPEGEVITLNWVFEYNEGGNNVYMIPNASQLVHSVTTATTLWAAQNEIMTLLTNYGFTCAIVGSDLEVSRLVTTGSLGWTTYTLGITSATTDWWTENAAEYLILRTLVECNRLGHVFVGNKEGNLPSPEKQAEQLLQDLIMQDNAGELAGGQIELY